MEEKDKENFFIVPTVEGRGGENEEKGAIAPSYYLNVL